MSTTDIPQIVNLVKSIDTEKCSPNKEQQQIKSTNTDLTQEISTSTKKLCENSHSSDSGKSSSCSPVGLDCSFDSGIAGVLLDTDNMELHKRIQQCQCILLALERDREYFYAIRNRLSKITHRKKKETNENEFFCNVCCTEIDPEDEKTFVKCYICNKYICRNIKCAEWLPKTAQWECELCQSSKESLAQTSSWVAEQITFHQEKLIHPPRARSEIYIPISECNDSSIHFESVSQIGANSTTITAEQKLKIREYVEEVVAKLLGGNLDTIAVNQLSKSENYLPDPKLDNSHNGRMSTESMSLKTNGHDFSDISETRLRQMIQKIIAETINLPPLSNGHAVSEISLDRRSKAADNRPLSNGYQRHRTEHYFEPTIYQDLLATAVINKIVDKKLNNNHEDSVTDIVGGTGGVGDDLNDNIRNNETDQNFNIEKSSTTSGSSVEPHSDCSYPEIEQILNTNDDKSSELLRNSDRDSVMSDYLASHLIPLPDLNAMATESDEDDYMSVTSSAIGDGTWEKNWLFKKKRTTLSGSVTANSIGIVVPDPKEDVRAQIGDKTADEVSDLSELGSDTDDSLDSLRSKLEPINDRLINKHIIGGQNNKMILDELIERSSMISNTLPSGQESPYMDTCNEHVIDAPTKNEAINDNVTQQTSAMEQKVSPALQDQNSNSLTASDDSTESIGCIGFSSIEIIDHNQDIPSVVEILAAMTLGPMLAVPTCDQPATLTVSDYNAFTDLKELALAEIKARSLELTPRNLDVIPEETCDIINQTENVIDNNASDKIYFDSSEPNSLNLSNMETKLNTLNESNDNDLEIVIGDTQTTLIENIKRDTATNSLTFQSTKSDNQEIVLNYDHQTIHSPDEIKSEMHINEKIETQNSTQQNELVIIDQISTELQDNSENSKCPEIKTNDMNSEIKNSNILDFAKNEESQQFLHSTETQNNFSPTNEAKISDILPDNNLNCINNKDISAPEEQHSQSEIEEKKFIEEELILKKNSNELQTEVTTDSTSINHSLETKVNESISDEHSLEVDEATSSVDQLETQHRESEVDISKEEATISTAKMPEKDASETQLENTIDTTKNKSLKVEATSSVDSLETQHKESEVDISKEEATILTAKMPEKDASETQLENTIDTTKNESLKVEAASSVDSLETKNKENEVDISNQEATISTAKMSEEELENTTDTTKNKSLKVEATSSVDSLETQHKESKVDICKQEATIPTAKMSEEDASETQLENTTDTTKNESLKVEAASSVDSLETKHKENEVDISNQEATIPTAKMSEEDASETQLENTTDTTKNESLKVEATSSVDPLETQHKESEVDISNQEATIPTAKMFEEDVSQTQLENTTDSTKNESLKVEATFSVDPLETQHKESEVDICKQEATIPTAKMSEEDASETQLENTTDNTKNESLKVEATSSVDPLETQYKESEVDISNQEATIPTAKMSEEDVSETTQTNNTEPENSILIEEITKEKPYESQCVTSAMDNETLMVEPKEQLTKEARHIDQSSEIIEEDSQTEIKKKEVIEEIILKETSCEAQAESNLDQSMESKIVETISTEQPVDVNEVISSGDNLKTHEQDITVPTENNNTEENISNEQSIEVTEVISSVNKSQTRIKDNTEPMEPTENIPQEQLENTADNKTSTEESEENTLDSTKKEELLDSKPQDNTLLNEQVTKDEPKNTLETEVSEEKNSKEQLSEYTLNTTSNEVLAEDNESNETSTNVDQIIYKEEHIDQTNVKQIEDISKLKGNENLSTSKQIEEKEVTEEIIMNELSGDAQIEVTEENISSKKPSKMDEVISFEDSTETKLKLNLETDEKKVVENSSEHRDENFLTTSAEQIEEKNCTDDINLKQPSCDTQIEETLDSKQIDDTPIHIDSCEVSKTEENISAEKLSEMNEVISSETSNETKRIVNTEPSETTAILNNLEHSEEGQQIEKNEVTEELIMKESSCGTEIKDTSDQSEIDNLSTSGEQIEKKEVTEELILKEPSCDTVIKDTSDQSDGDSAEQIDEKEVTEKIITKEPTCDNSKESKTEDNISIEKSSEMNEAISSKDSTETKLEVNQKPVETNTLSNSPEQNEVDKSHQQFTTTTENIPETKLEENTNTTDHEASTVEIISDKHLTIAEESDSKEQHIEIQKNKANESQHSQESQDSTLVSEDTSTGEGTVEQHSETQLDDTTNDTNNKTSTELSVAEEHVIVGKEIDTSESINVDNLTIQEEIIESKAEQHFETQLEITSNNTNQENSTVLSVSDRVVEEIDCKRVIETQMDNSQNTDKLATQEETIEPKFDNNISVNGEISKENAELESTIPTSLQFNSEIVISDDPPSNNSEKIINEQPPKILTENLNNENPSEAVTVNSGNISIKQHSETQTDENSNSLRSYLSKHLNDDRSVKPTDFIDGQTKEKDSEKGTSNLPSKSEINNIEEDRKELNSEYNTTSEMHHSETQTDDKVLDLDYPNMELKTEIASVEQSEVGAGVELLSKEDSLEKASEERIKSEDVKVLDQQTKIQEEEDETPVPSPQSEFTDSKASEEHPKLDDEKALDQQTKIQEEDETPVQSTSSEFTDNITDEKFSHEKLLEEHSKLADEQDLDKQPSETEMEDESVKKYNISDEQLSNKPVCCEYKMELKAEESISTQQSNTVNEKISNEKQSSEKLNEGSADLQPKTEVSNLDSMKSEENILMESPTAIINENNSLKITPDVTSDCPGEAQFNIEPCTVERSSEVQSSSDILDSTSNENINSMKFEDKAEDTILIESPLVTNEDNSLKTSSEFISDSTEVPQSSYDNLDSTNNEMTLKPQTTEIDEINLKTEMEDQKLEEVNDCTSNSTKDTQSSNDNLDSTSNENTSKSQTSDDINEINLKTEIEDQQLELVADSVSEATKAINQNLMENKSHENSTVAEKDTPVNESVLESNLEKHSSADVSEDQKEEQSSESQVETISDNQNDNSTTCEEGNQNIPTVDVVELNSDTIAEEQSTNDEIISKGNHCETQVENISESTNVQNVNSSECQECNPSIDIVEDIVVSKEQSTENEIISNEQNCETEPLVSEDSSKLIDSALQSENISDTKDSACLNLSPSEQTITISKTISETLPEDISDSDKVQESPPIEINSSEKTIENGNDTEKISKELQEMHEHCEIKIEATLNSIKTEDSKCSECIEVSNVEGQKLDEQQTVVAVENITDRSKSDDISESTSTAQIKLEDDKVSAAVSDIISEEIISKTEDNPSGEHLTITDEANLEAEKLEEKFESKEIVIQAVCQEEQPGLAQETISKEQQVQAISCDKMSEEDLNVSLETITKKIDSEIQSDSSSETLKTEDSLIIPKEKEEIDNQTDFSNYTITLDITMEKSSEATITEIVKIESEDCSATTQSSKAEPENISSVLDEPLLEQADDKLSEIQTEYISNIQKLKESNEQLNTDEILAVEKSMQIEESSVCRKGGEKCMTDVIKSEEIHLPEQAEVINNEILENLKKANDNEREKTVKSEDLLKSEEVNEEICQVQNLESQTEGVSDSLEPLAGSSEYSLRNQSEKSAKDSFVFSDNVTESEINVNSEKQTSEVCDTLNSATEIVTDENPIDVDSSDLLKPSEHSKDTCEENHSINNEADLKSEMTSDISTSNDQTIILSAPTEIETNSEVESVSTNKCEAVVDESIPEIHTENISEFINQSKDSEAKPDLVHKYSSAEVIANEKSTNEINTIDQPSETHVEANVEIIKENLSKISNQTVQCITEDNEQSNLNDETNSTEQSVEPIISEEHSSQIIDPTKLTVEQSLTADETTHTVESLEVEIQPNETKDKESEFIETTRNTTESIPINSLEQNSDIHIESNVIAVSDISDNIEESISRSSCIMESASTESKLATNIETVPEEISSTEAVSESQITIQEGLPKEQSILIDESIQSLNDTSRDSTLETASKENKPNENSTECNETNNEQQLADVKHQPIIQISNEDSSETKESIVESTQQAQISLNETNSIQPSEKQIETNVQKSLNKTKSTECSKEESTQQASLKEEINESTSSKLIVVSKIEENIANVLDTVSVIQDSNESKAMECSETQMETKESSPEVIVVESTNEENITKDQVNITKSEHIVTTSQEKISLNPAYEESNSLDQPLEIQIKSNETITKEKSSEILDPITSSTTNKEDYKTPNPTEQISITNEVIREEKSCEISQTVEESITTECSQKEMSDLSNNANSIQSFDQETKEIIIRDTSLDSIAESTIEQNKHSIDSNETNSKEQPPIDILDSKVESKTNETSIIKHKISLEVETTEIQTEVNVTTTNENSSKMPDKNAESTNKESIPNIDQPSEIQNEIYDVISKEISINVKESTKTENESNDHAADEINSEETQLAVKKTILKDTLSEIPEPIVESINKEINEPSISASESTAQEQSSDIVTEQIPKENLSEKSKVIDSTQNEDSLAEQLATQQVQNPKIVQKKSLEVSDLIVESSSIKDESQNLNSTTPSEAQDHLNIIVESTMEKSKIRETSEVFDQTVTEERSVKSLILPIELNSIEKTSETTTNEDKSETQDKQTLIVESTTEESKIQKTSEVIGQTITEKQPIESQLQPNEITSIEKTTEFSEATINEEISEVTDQTITKKQPVETLPQTNEIISIEKTTEFSEATINEEISEVTDQTITQKQPVETLPQTNEIISIEKTTEFSEANKISSETIEKEKSNSTIEEYMAKDQSVIPDDTNALEEKSVTVERNETSSKAKSSETSDILESNLNEPSVPQEETNSKEKTSSFNEAISVETSPAGDIGNASSNNTASLVEKNSIDKTSEKSPKSNETIPEAVTESPNIISEETFEIKLKTNESIPEDNSDKITDLVIESTTKNNLTTAAALESKENISEIPENIKESSTNETVSNEGNSLEQPLTKKLDLNIKIPEENSDSIKDSVTNDHLLIADENNSKKQIRETQPKPNETIEKLGGNIVSLEESTLKDKSIATDETNSIGQLSEIQKEILAERKDPNLENKTEKSTQNQMIPNEISPEIPMTIEQKTNEEIVLNIQSTKSDKIITETQNKCETLTVLPEPIAQSNEVSPEDKSVVIDIKTTKSVTESQSSKETLSNSSAEHKTNESTTDQSALSIETNSEELLPATPSRVEVISLNIQSSEISIEGFSESISSGPVSEQLGSKVEYISEASTSVEQLEVCDKTISKEQKPVPPPEISIESLSESTSSEPISEQTGSKVEYISESSTSVEQLEVNDKTISKEQKPLSPPATSSDKQSNLATSEIKEKSGIIKKLTRQYRVEDTPPSFEDVSPQIMPQTMPQSSTSTNTLADLCQKYINDKTLLTALETRRRRTLLMHRFLSTLDISHSSGDSIEETKNIHTEVLDSENPIVYENYNLSHDHESDRDDVSDTFIVQINDHNQVSYNFINTVLFSDQLSYDSKINDESRSNTVEEFINNDDDEEYDNDNDDDDENDNIAINLITTTTTATNNLINSTTTTNNSFTAINTKDINTNSNNNYNHKQTLTNISGCTPTFNQKYSNHNQLTSAVQNNETTHTTSTTRRLRKSRHNINDHTPIINIDHVNVEIIINESGSGLIKRNQGVDGDSKDEDEEDDDVALFRHFVPGSIAEREYKKWYNAVEMPNNPYAPEALKRRISGSQERFIDLPNISPTKDTNPLDLLDNQKLDNDENKTRESDYKRYSRDYYINSGLTSPQMSPALEVSTNDTKDNREPTKKQTPTSEKETSLDLYKAMPAQVDQSGNSCYMDCISLSPTTELETNATTTSDSDTIKMNDIAKAQQDKEVTTTNETKATDDDNNTNQRPTSLAFSKSESCGNVITPNRGSTPTAFKFLQPKRKLLEPNQVLSVDEDEEQTATSPSEKPVIEAEVVKALPSVKALAKAFLMTTNTKQAESRWLRKARTLSQSGKKTSPTPKRSLDIPMRSNLSPKIEDDITITSDLSSLETDSSSVGNELSSTLDIATSNESSDLPATSGNTIPVPVREGVLKNNIAFFENLKNKN